MLRIQVAVASIRILGLTVAMLLSVSLCPRSVTANSTILAKPELPADLVEDPPASEPIQPLIDLSAVVLPELPPLGEADRFLPSAEEEIRLTIKLTDRRVYVYEGEALKTSYPVAVGKGGWETPTGSFKVIEKQKNPIWQNPFKGTIIPPGRNNPLGTRWIGFWTDGTNYIGFHGTPNVSSVGRPASHGCIRMFDKDVQQLFELVKVGTPVTVTR